MRIFSILMAALVAVALYAWVVERDALREAFGLASGTTAQDPAPVQSISAENPDDDALIKVIVQRSTAREIDSAVLIRGQTEAARQVDVRAETTATVISEPLRKGAFVEEDALLCQLDPGTRPAALAEARARLNEAVSRETEAQSRVPEAQARVVEADARLEEALINQNVARKLNQDGFAAETRMRLLRRHVRRSKRRNPGLPRRKPIFRPPQPRSKARRLASPQPRRKSSGWTFARPSPVCLKVIRPNWAACCNPAPFAQPSFSWIPSSWWASFPKPKSNGSKPVRWPAHGWPQAGARCRAA